MTRESGGSILRRPMLNFPSLDRFLILLLLVLPAAEARDEEPLRPQEAYQYAVSDTGDALEVDWAIEDGYYLYRKELKFETTTEGIDLRKARLPAGQTHEDEFFGRQQVFRERFYVTIPYTVDGERPASMELVIKSRGCWDGGLCYPPQSWTETVELKQEKQDLPALGGTTAAPGLGAATGEFPPPEEVFFPDLFALDGNTVEVGIRILPGYYVYKDKIAVRSLSDNAMAGRLELPPGTLHHDEFFGETVVYYDEVVGRLTIARATPEAMDLDLELDYQGCADAGLCYQPQTVALTVALPEAEAVSDLAAIRPPQAVMVSEQDRLAQLIVEGKLWRVLATFFGLGLLLAFTPCVLPMIPILMSIIAGEGDKTSPLRGFTLALSYVIGMALIYTAAGVAAAAAGTQLQAAFNQPWVLMLFAGLFVALALAMFGGYDLQMPSSLQSRLAGLSGSQKSGTTIGAFVMGALSALIVTACVAPALIAALIVMAQTADLWRGGAALFAMSLGMGTPLLFVGAAQGHVLPRSGAWMVAVKTAFGFMLLGLAIWMLRTILPGGLSMMLWATLVFMAGVFLGGLSTLGSGATATQKLGKGFGVLAMLYGLLLGLGALTGGTNPLKPLATMNFAGGSAAVPAEDHLEFKRIKTVEDLERELAGASERGQTVMLDFYADWCVSCIEMEEYTFTDSGVQATLADTLLLQADVTANDEQDKELLQQFGVFGPPTIIFFGSDGRQREGYEVVGFMNASDFSAHVDAAFSDNS